MSYRGYKRHLDEIANFFYPTKWINKFGYNPDVDTGTEDIWSGGGLWVAPTQARVHNIASTSDNDNKTASTGALTIRIYGLDSNYNEITEDVTLSGTDNVATTKSFIRIYRMYVLTAGSTGSNEGDITATAVTDGTVTASIPTGFNQSTMAIYTVPAGYTGFMHNFDVHVDSTAAAEVTLKIYVREVNSVWRTKYVALITDASPQFQHEYSPPMMIPAKSDVRLEVTSNANNIPITGTFNLRLDEHIT